MNTEHFSNLVHQQLHEQEISSNSVHRKRLKQENSIDSVHQRLFKQDTVNTLARRGTIKPVDSLDLSLSSVYNHETDLFLNRKQTILQMANWPDDPNKKRLYEEMKQRQRTSLHHPLIIGNDQQKKYTTKKKSYTLKYLEYFAISEPGGITERKSPHSVKLICIGHHTHTTNPGYSRQPLDGNIFNY